MEAWGRARVIEGGAVASVDRYRLNFPGEALHVPHCLRTAQSDRPLVVVSCAAQARGHALSGVVHPTELTDGGGKILSRGLLDSWQRLRVVHIHTVAFEVHPADLPLAHTITPLGTDLIRRHRSRVVDRHALTPAVNAANEIGRFGVALV